MNSVWIYFHSTQLNLFKVTWSRFKCFLPALSWLDSPGNPLTRLVYLCAAAAIQNVCAARAIFECKLIIKKWSYEPLSTRDFATRHDKCCNTVLPITWMKIECLINLILEFVEIGRNHLLISLNFIISRHSWNKIFSTWLINSFKWQSQYKLWMDMR